MSAFASRHDRDRDRARRALARVCGSFGHELNNIAMLILGQSRAIESLTTDEKLGRAASRLEEIACDLRNRLDELAIISAKAGGQRLRVALDHYLENLSAGCSTDEPDRPLLLLGDLPVEGAEINFDEPSFRLAVEMLLDHVTPKGRAMSVTVTCSTASDLGLPGPRERGAVRISLRIPSAMVTDDLVQAADAADRSILIGFEESALALALLKATARRAQGRLLTALDDGELHLEFLVPQFMDIPSFVAAGPGTNEPRPRIQRVLVVEDDYHVRQVTVSMFGKLGFEVMAVCDFEEACDAMESDLEVDLIVSDYTVPKGRAGEVLKIASSLRPETPLLCVSGSDHSAEVADLSPQVQFLRKPYTMADIRDSIKKAGITRSQA